MRLKRGSRLLWAMFDHMITSLQVVSESLHHTWGTSHTSHWQPINWEQQRQRQRGVPKPPCTVLLCLLDSCCHMHQKRGPLASQKPCHASGCYVLLFFQHCTPPSETFRGLTFVLWQGGQTSQAVDLLNSCCTKKEWHTAKINLVITQFYSNLFYFI